MPIRVQTPDGNIAEFPDGMDNAQIEAVLQKQYPKTAAQPQQQPEKPNALVDSLRVIPGSLAQGVAGLAGLPGDIESGLNAGADWIMEKLGADPQRMEAMRQNREQQPMRLPTSEGINKAISEPFGGYYEPKTLEGEYTRTVAQFAPAALAPGSALTRFARVAVPGVASETAGQMTKGKPYEPLARAGGALAGGIGLGMAEGAAAARNVPKTPSMEELGKLKSATYKAAEQQGVVINPASVQKFASDISDDILNNNVVSEKLHPQTLAALDSIRSEASKNTPMSLERADILRQEVIGAFENASSRDARLLRKVKDGLDNYLDNLAPTDTLAGDAAVAVPILKNARALAAREFKAAEIQKLIDLAENSARTNYSQSGYEQALRAQFRSFNAKLIKDPALAKTFTAAERAAIEKVAEGGPLGNALRQIGKYSPTGPVSSTAAAVLGGGTGATLGSMVGGPFGAPVGAALGAGLVGGTGALGRAGATAITNKNAQLAAELMRRGAPLPQSQGSAALIADLLLSQQGAR